MKLSALWFQKRAKTSSSPRKRRRSSALEVERLEDRSTPSASISPVFNTDQTQAQPGDQSPLSVNLTVSPSTYITSNNQPVLSATVSDTAGSVTSVQFQYSNDGGRSWTNAGSPVTSSPYTYTSSALADGTYQFRAIAHDNLGNAAISTPNYGLTNLGFLYGSSPNYGSSPHPNPQAPLVLDSAGDLFGTTYGGGAYGSGSVFEIVKGSATITTLASFNYTNGANPTGGLVVDSSGNVFGTTLFGGPSNDGVVFELVKNSGTVTTLASFNGTNGQNPYGVIQDTNGNLFGTTQYGGSNGIGDIFEVAKGTNSVIDFINFNGTNGANPIAGLVEDSNGNLFGDTEAGGSSGQGVVFEVLHGTHTLHSLSFNGMNGASPSGPLTLDANGNAFGVTSAGGSDDDGVVFEAKASPQSIVALASFTGANGANPYGSVVVDSSDNVFGTTQMGGSATLGVLFEVVSNSAVATDVVDFTGSNGSLPSGGLIADANGNLFGTTTAGAQFGYGNIFEFAKNAHSVSDVADFSNTRGANPNSGLVEDTSGNLFGTATLGGTYNEGAVFETPHGSGVTQTVASFNGTNGAAPIGSLVQDSNGNIYGVTQGGGAQGDGVVFEVAAGTNSISVIAAFNGTDGATPLAGLTIDASGDLFGTTTAGGDFDFGTVFEIVHGSGTITTLASFQGSDGSSPEAALILDSSGDLFGTASTGGGANDGSVFEVVKSSGAITVLAYFDGSAGVNPSSSLVMNSSGDLFGTTVTDGNAGYGTVYEIVNNSQTISTLAFFDGTDGASPSGALTTDASGDIFGTASAGSDNGVGSVFEFSPSSDTITTLVTFNGANGAAPEAGLIADGSGNYFGTTYGDNLHNNGSIFEIANSSATLAIDTTPPTASITVMPPSSTTSTTASFSFVGSDPIVGGVSSGVAYFQYQLDGGTYQVAASPVNFSNLPTGAHSFNVRAVDAVGNVGTPAAYSWNVVAPTATSIIDNGPNPSTSAQSVSFTVTVTGGVPNGETVTLEDASNNNAVVPTSGNALSSGSATLTVAAGALSVGMHNIFAVYNGDSSFGQSQSTQVVHTVTASANPISITGININAGTAPIISASEASNIVTIVTAGPHGFKSGDPVVIANVSGYNGVYHIATVATNSFTINFGTTTGLLTVTNSGTATDTADAGGLLVNGVAANGHSASFNSQRSMVDSIVYTFNQAVNLGAGAFTITVLGQGGQSPSIAYSSPDGGITWTVTFSGTGVTGNSIANGEYQIVLNSTAVTAASGGGTLANSDTEKFYRLFGDTIGNGHQRCSSPDRNTFNGSFGTTSTNASFLAYLDSNDDGRVNAVDRNAFNGDFGTVYSSFSATI